ncbi:ABC transporter substrate-binding protein [Nocardioides kongjuensis]|uniref:ABC-type nitrate/sulfonate/bicarbonate transport system substrate-binding protein n=1 Tax=Nocardioides kongjuensis TaxID=349522 RepID=A0A852S1Y2_9ACTN|nr:ABC transporter substrate-binding protein [Nocardioides kongjuensis]NYD32832.1 ABC-type nitrate/sulfonate/bicarbonate transport system substrate-binding protein [Nocardioides kongjuensis]
MTGSQRSMTSRRGFLRYTGMGALAIGSAGLLAACGDDGGSAAGKGGAAGALTKPTRFRIASAPGDNYFLDQVNVSEKQFEAYNLQIGKLIFPQSGVQAMQLLAGGGVDGMVQDPILTMASYVNGQKGKRPVMVGMRIPETTYSIVANAGTDFPDDSASFEDKMKALKGKRVGVAAVGAGSDQQLKLALEAAGMTYDDVEHVGVGQFASGIAQMKAKRLEAYVTVTWATTRLAAAQTGGRVYVDFLADSTPEVLRNQQVQYFITREDFLEKNPAVIQAWLDAQTEAKDWVVANPDKAADLLNKTSFDGKGEQFAKDYITHFTDVVVPKIQPDWRVPKDAVDFMIDIAVQLGTVKEGQVSYEDLVAESARA